MELSVEEKKSLGKILGRTLPRSFLRVAKENAFITANLIERAIVSKLAFSKKTQAKKPVVFHF